MRAFSEDLANIEVLTEGLKITQGENEFKYMLADGRLVKYDVSQEAVEIALL